MLLFVMLVAGCSGASPSGSAADGDGAAADGAGSADLSSVEAEQVFSGMGGTDDRGGASLTVADEIRVLDLGRVCVRDREAGGHLCNTLDEPSAAAVSVEVGLENTSNATRSLRPGDATMFAGALPAETADQYARSFEPTVVDPGAEVTGSMVWVLSGSVADVVSAMEEGDYGLEIMVRGADGDAVLIHTIVGGLEE